MRKAIEFIREHRCEQMGNVNTISIEKYDITGDTGWYYCIHRKKKPTMLYAISFCPHCGKKLD